MADSADRNIDARLARIEGQVRGLRRMYEDARPCLEVFQQIASVKAAVDQVGLLLLHAEVRECWRRIHEADDEENGDEHLGELLKAVERWARA